MDCRFVMQNAKCKMQNADVVNFLASEEIYDFKKDQKFDQTFQSLQSSRQRLDLMRKLQLSLLCFKMAKLRFDILDRVNTSRM